MREHDPVPGSCLCGGVSFELSLPFLQASCCHCEHCRKHSGNFGSMAMEVPGEQMKILSGDDLLASWRPAPGLAIRFFCRRCGSSLYGMNEPESETVWVRMGVLDADPGLRPSRHTWVDSAPAWLPIPEDGLPRYGRRPS